MRSCTCLMRGEALVGDRLAAEAEIFSSLGGAP